MSIIMDKSFKNFASTHPFLDAARLAQGPLRSRDTVGDTAVAFAEAPELSTHFLGKKATASWSGVIVSCTPRRHKDECFHRERTSDAESPNNV